jgi:chaperonin GroEL
MQKKVLYGTEARNAILSGVIKIVNAVKVTMGASGKNVLIGRAQYIEGFAVPYQTHVSKDGVTVARSLELSDPVENRGALMVKEAAYKTVQQAGDATTATCVLAGALIEGGINLVNNGANSQQVKKGIDAAVIEAVDQLKKLSTPVSGNNDRIFQVATVSANNDEFIGRLIADAFAKIGEDGVIDIEEGKSVNTEIKVADGYKFERGWVSPLFVNNKPKEICEFQDAFVLLYEKRINHHTQIEKALEIALKAGRPLIIVCEDAEDEGLAFLAMNNARAAIRVCVVKSPGFGESRREGMDDLAAITGATYISDLRGVGIKEVTASHFGTVSKAIISKDETVLIGGGGKKEEITALVNDLKMNLTQAKTEEEKFPIEKRIARLSGGVAVIHVGAATETEMKEKIDRVDDAVRATKAAISEGFVAGGGTAFLRIVNNEVPANKHVDFYKGWTLVFEALQTPLKQICDNAGAETDKILKQVKSTTGNNGYNVLTDTIEDLVGVGIIDSTKALRCALVNASSVAGMVITSECLIIDEY